jgi:hypothetical protein
MGKSYTKGAQNAQAFGDLFAAGKVKAGYLTFGATAATDALTHGLGAAPTFVLLQTSGELALTWAADTTTLTVTRATTVGAVTWSYLIGILA